MKIRLVKQNENPITRQMEITHADIGWPYSLSGDEQIADFIEYTNGVSGQPDPILKWAPMKWTHMSTAKRNGYDVQNVETGEIVTVENLSPW